MLLKPPLFFLEIDLVCDDTRREKQGEEQHHHSQRVSHQEISFMERWVPLLPQLIGRKETGITPDTGSFVLS